MIFPDVPWDEIKERYDNGDALRAIAADYNRLSIWHIRVKAVLEGWNEESDAQRQLLLPTLQGPAIHTTFSNTRHATELVGEILFGYLLGVEISPTILNLALRLAYPSGKETEMGEAVPRIIGVDGLDFDAI